MPDRRIRLRQAISQLRRMGRVDWLLLSEALVVLAASTLAIRLLAFRHVGRLASLPLRSKHQQPEPLVGRVRWAVEAAARRSPWRTVCFQQGLACQVMLRRRGVNSTLYFGAAPDRAKGLAAHVWVKTENQDVIGCEQAASFAVLTTFPDRRPFLA